MNNKSTDNRSPARKSRTVGAHSAPPAKKAAGNTRQRTRSVQAEEQTFRLTPEPAAAGDPSALQAPESEKNVTRRSIREQEQAQQEEQRRIKAGAKRVARKKAMKKVKIVLAVLLVLVLLAGGGIAYWGYQITNSPVNLPNVYIKDIPVGGLTYEQTLAALDAQDWDETASEMLTVTLPTDVSFQIDLCESGAMLTKENAAAAAYRYGHSGNWFSNLFTYLSNYLSPMDVIGSEKQLNDEYISRSAQAGIAKFKEATDGGGYEVDEEAGTLRMVKGAGEMDIDLDNLCQQIRMALLNDVRAVDYDHIDNQLKMPDFDGIYETLAVETEDAYFVEGSFEVVDEVVGCSFDVDKAKSLWQAAQPGDTVEIGLVITEPEVTGDDLRGLLFRDLLGSMTTEFKSSNSNRINNIHLAVDKISGYVLMPGDVFSYNDVVGQRTTEAGFMEADAYMNGEVVKEIGGGICQVSSTLYTASMYAQMETVNRTNHYFKVSYMAMGYDATVSWGTVEFKFRNSREYPVQIIAYCDDEERTLTVEIMGTDTDGSYVDLRTTTGAVFDDEYPDVVIGYGVQCYRTVYDADGNWLYEVKEPYSSYFLHDYDIKWPKDKDKNKDKDKDKPGDDGYTTPAPAPAPDPEPAPAPDPEPAPPVNDDYADNGDGGGGDGVVIA